MVAIGLAVFPVTSAAYLSIALDIASSVFAFSEGMMLYEYLSGSKKRADVVRKTQAKMDNCNRTIRELGTLAQPYAATESQTSSGLQVLLNNSGPVLNVRPRRPRP